MKKKISLILLVFILFLTGCSKKYTVMQNVNLYKLTKNDEIDYTLMIEKNSYTLYLGEIIDDNLVLEKVGIVRVLAIRLYEVQFTYDIKTTKDIASIINNTNKLLLVK